MAGSTTHGLERCKKDDDCPTLLNKINKLIESLKERRKEMEPFSTTGQPWSVYVGHAIQIRQQYLMLKKCQAFYKSKQPPCCEAGGDPLPDYDPFPLPEWKPEPYTPRNGPPPVPPSPPDLPPRGPDPRHLIPLILIPVILILAG